MNPIPKKPPSKIIIGIIALGAILVTLWGYRLASFMQDVKAISTIDMGDNKKFLPPLVEGLSWPEKMREAALELYGSPFETANRKHIPLEMFVEKMERITEREAFERAIEGRISAGFRSPTKCPPNPAFVDFRVPRPNYREIRENARSWYAIGRYQAISRKYDRAFMTMLGIALLANESEASEKSGLTVIGKMIGTALRGIAATGLLEIAPDLQLPKGLLIEGIDRLQTLEKEAAPISQAFLNERNFLPSLANVVLSDQWEKQPGAAKKRRPTRLANYLIHHSDVQAKLHEFFDKGIEASGEPFQQANEKLKPLEESFNSFAERPTSFGWHWLEYAWSPETFYVEMNLAIARPSMRKALGAEVAGRQKLRGAQVVLAIFGFQKNFGVWPNSLDEVGKWIGKPLPLDLFVDQPLRYESTNPPRLFSVGPDGKPKTEDDLNFIPLWPSK